LSDGVTSESDDALAKLNALVDPAAIAALYDASQAGVSSVALSVVKDRSLAEDVVQDALLRALEHAASWQEGTELRAWIFRILRNAFLDEERRRGTERRGLAAMPAPEAPAPVLVRWKVWRGLACATTTCPKSASPGSRVKAEGSTGVSTAASGGASGGASIDGAASPPPPPPGAATATGAAAVTPNVSSMALMRSDSSSTEMLLSSSIHSSVVAMCVSLKCE